MYKSTAAMLKMVSIGCIVALLSKIWYAGSRNGAENDCRFEVQ